MLIRRLDDTSPIVPTPPATASFGGYRSFLFDSLLRQQISAQPVGSMYGCGSHEGHSGWTCADLAAIAREAVAVHQPDVILLMCGTNDLFFTGSQRSPAGSAGASASATVGRMAKLLDEVFAAAPKVTLLMSTTAAINATRCRAYKPPCPAAMPSQIAELNAALPALVAEQQRLHRDVSLHDVNAEAAWVEADYYTWGIHRSQQGFAKMAGSWERALKRAINGTKERLPAIKTEDQTGGSSRANPYGTEPYPIFWAVGGPNASAFGPGGSVDVGQWGIKHNNFTICGGMTTHLMPALPEGGGAPIRGGVPQSANFSLADFIAGLSKTIAAKIPDPDYDGLAVFDFEAFTPIWSEDTGEHDYVQTAVLAGLCFLHRWRCALIGAGAAGWHGKAYRVYSVQVAAPLPLPMTHHLPPPQSGVSRS